MSKHQPIDVLPRQVLEATAPTEPKAKRKPRSKEERAAELLADAAREKDVRLSRYHLDLIRSALGRKDWSEANAYYLVLGLAIGRLRGIADELVAEPESEPTGG